MIKLHSELAALVAAVDTALKRAGSSHLDLAVSCVRDLCMQIGMADDAAEPRALQPAARELYGVLKGLRLCAFLTNAELEAFGDRIYRPNSPYQGDIVPLQEIIVK